MSSSFRRQAGGLLAAEVDGYRLLVRAPIRAGGAWTYTVLRRQYGQGSLLALVGEGKAGTLADAVRAAERLAGRVVTSEAVPHGSDSIDVPAPSPAPS